ncbi:hypothetical protein EG68_05747 [Paragonimus skrjabini miyazakii]|uniref:Transmembrane protein 107 n=1 Tax=Paragonimus skrjabini miyazakii TaxID=59628 RepID=A0A8S9YQK0_9TREM|nr:hypothetical protein EG68_05747 [Paragonimus skrjabini miyazakii]
MKPLFECTNAVIFWHQSFVCLFKMQKVCEIDLIRFGVVSLQLVLTINALLNKETFITATSTNKAKDIVENEFIFYLSASIILLAFEGFGIVCQISSFSGLQTLLSTGAHTFGMLAMVAFLLNVYDIYAYRLIVIVSIFIPSGTELITWVIFFTALCSKMPFKP